MAGEKEGLAAAVEMLGGAGDELVAGDAGQGHLFEADVPLPITPAIGKSGPQGGRPAGARNKTTEAWRAYILSRYRSPMVVLAEMYSRTAAELAEDMGLYQTVGLGEHASRVLDTGKAAAIQVEAAKALLPYLHQRQPLAIEPVGDGKRGLLVLGAFEVGDGDDGAQLPLANSEQDQGLIDVTPDKSDGNKSDGRETFNDINRVNENDG